MPRSAGSKAARRRGGPPSRGPSPRRPPRSSARPVARSGHRGRPRSQGGRGCPRPLVRRGRGSPALASRSRRTGSWSWGDDILRQVALEAGAGDALEGFHVPAPGSRDDVVGERGSGGGLVPWLGLEPVAHELLVEAG